MSIPVPPRVVDDDNSETEEPVPLLQEDDEEDTASEQSDDDTNTSNDANSTDDEEEQDDAAAERQSEGEEDDEGGGAASGGDSDEGEEMKTKKNSKKRKTSTKKDTEDDLTLLGVPHGIHFDDDEDEEDDETDDNDSSEYFQKLKSNIRESYVATYHPESLSHNYDEIQTLARVVRNSAGVIVDDLHRTIPIMTKYEKTRIIGQRAKQLNEGAPAFIKIDSTVIDGYLIAVKELEQKKTPFIIRRPLPNGGSEYWRVQDLEIL
jgi:DNA-directed RNA polymerase subunit K/omega